MKWIKADLKHIINDLLEHGKSVSMGEIEDDKKGLKSQYVIKAKVGLNEKDKL
ncbi:hypothetical protein [Alkalihalobacterium elongatum]|uniref:hypothetical protein n=1 Tax=Alkalihalobacterium elongatum TaxID=2675466 RepID=UPI001C1F2244|nr:hypothetical protein [Alkalihalobacterium elongatum]